MKIAFSLIGHYSPIYKKNNYNGDLFACTYTQIPQTLEQESKFKKIHIVNPDQIISYKALARVSRTRDYMITQCMNMVVKEEEKSGKKYDMYIFATFRDIFIELPEVPGKFQSNYFSFSKIPSKIQYIPSIEIISDEFVRYNGNDSKSFYDLPHNILTKLVNKLFDGKVFLPNNIEKLKNEHVTMLIPSVIKTSENPFNYTSRRSIFSWEERFQQTLKQVESIYQCDENIQSYIMEGSRIGIRYLTELTKYASVILFVTDSKGDKYANKHPNKSIYEIYCMETMLKKVQTQWVFKFGGRYKLHDTFNLKDFLSNKAVFKVIPGFLTFAGTPIIECIIYSIPKEQQEEFRNIYKKIKEEILEGSNGAIESLLYKSIPEHHCVTRLGVFGRDAVYGFDNLV